MTQAALIAIDWGTSNLRATLLDTSGTQLDHRSAAGGVMTVTDGAFEDRLAVLCGDWIREFRVPLIASGMIGSRQGWREAPYLPCPAGLAQASQQLTRIALHGGASLHIVPGLTADGADGQPDVMRGEETQLWGAGLAAGAYCVLPGTHAKWAQMGEGGAVASFQTYLTGELFALLTRHGILGRLMEFGHEDPEAFDQGARLGLAEYRNATHVIFAARTLGLAGRISARGLPDFLSGVLIGVETGSATRGHTPRTVSVLGDEALSRRYERVLALAGIGATRVPDDATIRGQWRVACQAGLVREAQA